MLLFPVFINQFHHAVIIPALDQPELLLFRQFSKKTDAISQERRNDGNPVPVNKTGSLQLMDDVSTTTDPDIFSFLTLQPFHQCCRIFIGEMNILLCILLPVGNDIGCQSFINPFIR